MSNEHDFKKSKPYDPVFGCPKLYHKRQGYTVKKTGTYVPPRCVKSTTTYKESSKNFKKSVSEKATRRLRAAGVTQRKIRCPEGKIMRRAYVRVMSPNVRRQGYTKRTRSGKMIIVKPKARSIIVPATCIKDRGLPGTLKAGQTGIGPLRRGELKKHGYLYKNTADRRHDALRSAMKEFGALGVFHKLDAAAKLTVREAPEASKIFSKDRDWIRSTFGPLKAV
jgi:hypothetical protein